jgi:hypothetical protein
MALNFPDSPSVGDRYEINDVTYSWDGYSWQQISVGIVDTVRKVLISDNFLSEVGDELGCDTETKSFTVTLPANPVDFDEVSFLDIKGTFSVNNLNIARNGKLIGGLAEDLILSTDGAGGTLIFINGDWRQATSAIGGGSSLNYIHKDANYTASNGDFIYADTLTNGSFTVTLPLNPNDNDTIGWLDDKSSFEENNLVIDGNGVNIEGDSTFVVDVNKFNVSIVFDGNEWRVI